MDNKMDKENEIDQLNRAKLLSFAKILTQGEVEHLSDKEIKEMKRKNLKNILNQPVVRDALKKLSKE